MSPILPVPDPWRGLSNIELLRTYASLMASLRERGIVRSSNNPVADYTETLLARTLDARLQTQSSAGFDAIDIAGVRYQIKGRRLTPHNRSTQLSLIRNLDEDPFDVLAAVIYSTGFDIEYAATIPIVVVKELSTYRAHTHGHVFHFRRSVLEDRRVHDITDRVKTTASSPPE